MIRCKILLKAQVCEVDRTICSIYQNTRCRDQPTQKAITMYSCPIHRISPIGLAGSKQIDRSIPSANDRRAVRLLVAFGLHAIGELRDHAQALLAVFRAPLIWVGDGAIALSLRHAVE